MNSQKTSKMPSEGTNGVSNTNQKKVHKSNLQNKSVLDNKNHKTSFSERIFKHEYMRVFIEEAKEQKPKIKPKQVQKGNKNQNEIVSDKDSLETQKTQELKFKCLYCNEIRFINSLLPHIQSRKHLDKTPKEEHEKLSELITLLAPKTKDNENIEEDKIEKKTI